jgi:hypothetical protein
VPDRVEKPEVEHRARVLSGDHHMIEQRSADGGRPFDDGAGKREILFTRLRVGRWMIVNQHECAGCFAQDDTKNIAHADVQTVDAARRPRCLDARLPLTETSWPVVLHVRMASSRYHMDIRHPPTQAASRVSNVTLSSAVASRSPCSTSSASTVYASDSTRARA